MANLAIKGHATRGKEIIEILEMLGGKQFDSYNGNDINWCYTIINGSIEWDYPSNKYAIYTLEEFLEKYPYKVGDKVLMEGMPKTIKDMNWNSYSNEILYKVETNVRGFTEEYHVFAYDIQPYKEETIKKKIKAKCGIYSSSFCKNKHDASQCDECILVNHRKYPLYKWINGQKLKRCPHCEEYKLLTDFTLISDGSGRKYRSWCTKCLNAYNYTKGKNARKHFQLACKNGHKTDIIDVTSLAQMIKYVRQYAEKGSSLITIKLTNNGKKSI